MKTAKGFCNKYVTLQPLKATNQSSEAKATINSQFGVVAALVAKFTDLFDSFQHIFEKSLQSSACRLFSIKFPPQMVESHKKVTKSTKFCKKKSSLPAASFELTTFGSAVQCSTTRPPVSIHMEEV